MWDQPWRFPMRTLKHNCLGVHNVASVWSYQSLLTLLRRDCIFANDLFQETKGKERWGPLCRIWWSTFGGYLFVDFIIYDDSILNYILGLWQLSLYNTTHHQKGTIACRRRSSWFMLAPKGAGINIYVCVCWGAASACFHDIMKQWKQWPGSSFRLLQHSNLQAENVCFFDRKVWHQSVGWPHQLIDNFSMFIWHLLAMQSVEWVVSSEHSYSLAEATKAILFPWHFCIEWMCYFQIDLVKWSVECTQCVDHFWPYVRKGGTYFR